MDNESTNSEVTEMSPIAKRLEQDLIKMERRSFVGSLALAGLFLVMVGLAGFFIVVAA